MEQVLHDEAGRATGPRFMMCGRWLRVGAFLLLAFPAIAAPVDPQTQQQLLGILDSYNNAIIAGKLDAAMALMSAQLRGQAKAHVKTDKDRREALAMARMMVPDTVSVLHTFIDSSETHARLVTVATKVIPKGQAFPGGPPPGTSVRNGMTVSFTKEGGAWKFDEQLFGTDPSEAAGCKSETSDPVSSYDPDRHVSAGGPIVRTDFKQDYTLVVFSVVGDANCAFLPAKSDLARRGIDPALLVPYAIVTLNGIAHRTDPQKMLAESVEVQPEQ